MEALLASWDRHARIMANLAKLIDEKTRNAKASEDGWPIDGHLAHIHHCRMGWVKQVAPEHAEPLGFSYEKAEEGWVVISNLDELRHQLDLSEKAVRNAVEACMREGKAQVGPYSHPVFFLQHMLFHEGYHYGLLILALRNAGVEPNEDWQEANVWGIWRS